MTRTTTGRTRTAFAVTGALALALSGALAGVANAADEYGNIVEKDATLTIHKLYNPAQNEGAPDGTAAPTAAPVPGVVFTAYELTLDLKKPEDWDKLSKLRKADGTVKPDACQNLDSLGAGLVNKAGEDLAPTDPQGETTLRKRAPKAYLICEKSAPGDVVDKAAPFVITLPYNFNGKWLYDVHAYPKNTKSTIEKSVVAQTELGLGATVTFPVTTSVPAIAAERQYKYYRIRDTYAATLEQPTENSVATVVLAPAAGAKETLAKGVDYEVTVTGTTVMVNFLQPGLAKLKANPSAIVTTTFVGVVKKVGPTNNSATLASDTTVADQPAPPTPPDPNEPNNPSNEVISNWGDALVKKVDDADKTTVVNGAIFEVYEAKDPFGPNDGACTNEVAPGARPIAVNGQTTFTSTNGIVTIPGLFISDSVNSAGKQTHCYVLKEIQAAPGYVLPSGEKAYTALTVSIGANNVNVFNATVLNTKQSVPNLPLTGASGQVIMTILGVALFALAGGWVLVTRRRRHTQQG